MKVKKKNQKGTIPLEEMKSVFKTVFEISSRGRVGDMVGFSVGRKHFTLVKDTGCITEIKLKKLGGGGKVKRDYARGMSKKQGETIEEMIEDVAKSPIAVDATGDYAEFYLEDIQSLISDIVRDVIDNIHIKVNSMIERGGIVGPVNMTLKEILQHIQLVRQWVKKLGIKV